MCRRTSVVGAILAVALALLNFRASSAEDPIGSLLPKDLVGTYTMASSENSGRPVPKERIDGVLVRFTETSIIATDTDKKEVYAASYQLTSAENPAKITMTSTLEASKGVEASGLIERNGDTVRLIYRLPDGKEDPTEFKTRQGQIMVVLKRVAE